MRPFARTLLAGTVLVLLLGCQSKFTRDRFDMVRAGVDDREDVRKILGKPKADLDGDQWFYDDLDNHYSAVIHFDSAGRVKAKEWMDARTGTWEGRNPQTDPPPASGEEREKRTKTTKVEK